MHKKYDEEKRFVFARNWIVGFVIAAFYFLLLVLVPIGVRKASAIMTDARMYPYLVFSVTSVLAVLFAIMFRNARYKIDLGIWPMLLGAFLYYLSITVLGFYVSTFLAILYMTYWWKFKNKLAILVTAVITPILIYVFFTVFMNISLPSGLLF